MQRAMKLSNYILVVPDVPGMLLDLILKLPIAGCVVSKQNLV